MTTRRANGKGQIMVCCLALGLATAPPAARACAVAEPYAVTDIAAWPVVVVAEVTGYRRDARLEGHLTLAVKNVLKGEAPDRIEARWSAMLAEIAPHAWDRPTQLIVAVTPADGGFDLAVEMCGQAMLAEATPENLATVRAALGP